MDRCDVGVGRGFASRPLQIHGSRPDVGLEAQSSGHIQWYSPINLE